MARAPKVIPQLIPAPIPAPDAVLTVSEVASWLKIKPRQIQRLGIPFIDLGTRTKRYAAEDVRQWLAVKRAEGMQRAA